MKEKSKILKINRERKKHYIKTGSDKCLFCDSNDIWEVCYNYNRPGFYLCHIRCNDCNGEWEEKYLLLDVKVIAYCNINSIKK